MRWKRGIVPYPRIRNRFFCFVPSSANALNRKAVRLMELSYNSRAPVGSVIASHYHKKRGSGVG